MDTSKKMVPLLRIAKFTFIDEVRQRSFVALFVACVMGVLLIRGCYHGNYQVNGQTVDAETIVRTVSKATFHMIAFGVMVIAALLSMRIFRRDRAEGTLSSVLSKPIERWQYVIGKIIGVWGLSALFMFILHGLVFLLTAISLKIFMPEVLVGSLLCSINLLFVVIALLLLSLLMPDIVAFLCITAVGISGFIADGIAAASKSQFVQAMVQQSAGQPQAEVTWWKIVYVLWPKLLGVQQVASSLMEGEVSHGLAAVYPLVNVLLYCLILGALLFKRFATEDIT